jgi:DNA-directed RNA polymerase subunit N
MIIPVRCFTCGTVIGEIYEKFLQRVEMGEKPDEVLDTLGLERFCCRKMIVAHADLIDEVIPYG